LFLAQQHCQLGEAASAEAPFPEPMLRPQFCRLVQACDARGFEPVRQTRRTPDRRIEIAEVALLELAGAFLPEPLDQAVEHVGRRILRPRGHRSPITICKAKTIPCSAAVLAVDQGRDVGTGAVFGNDMSPLIRRKRRNVASPRRGHAGSG
jgi:hypothetical protein